MARRRRKRTKKIKGIDTSGEKWKEFHEKLVRKVNPKAIKGKKIKEEIPVGEVQTGRRWRTQFHQAQYRKARIYSAKKGAPVGPPGMTFRYESIGYAAERRGHPRTREYSPVTDSRSKAKRGTTREEYQEAIAFDDRMLSEEIVEKYGLELPKTFSFKPSVTPRGTEKRVAFFIGYDVSILFATDIDKDIGLLIKEEMGGLSKLVKAQMRTTDLPNSKEDNQYILKAIARSKRKAAKECERHGFGKVGDIKSKSVLNEKEYETMLYYNSRLNEILSEQIALTEGALAVARMMAFCKKDITKEEILMNISRIMAEYIEDGVRARLNAQGMADSDLLQSIEVEPAILQKDRKNVEKNEMEMVVKVGVIFKMNYYGAFVDFGRGPTQDTEKRYPNFRYSPFYQALREWALDNITVVAGGRGLRLGKRKESAADVLARKFFEKDSSRWYGSRFMTIGGTGATRARTAVDEMGYNEWMRSVRGEERRIVPQSKSSYWEGAEPGGPVGQRTAMTRDYGTGWLRRTKAGSPASTPFETFGIGEKGGASFEDVVYTIYRAINQKGFDGSFFLSDTLEDMMQKGVLEYYFSAFMYEDLDERASRHTDYVLARYRHIWDKDGNTEIKGK